MINAGGQIPPARSYHGCTSVGDVMVIWGGLGDSGYMNDAYLYNSLTTTWYELSTISSVIPSPRIGPCIAMQYSNVVIFGGLTLAGLSDEVWLYNLGTGEYTLLDSDNNMGPGPLYLASCRFSTDKLYTYYVMFGTGENDIPSNGVYILNTFFSTWTKVYRKNDYLTYNRAEVKVFKIRARYVYVGGERDGIPYVNLLYLNETTKQFGQFGVTPKFIYSAAVTFYRNFLYLHGGGSTLGVNLRRTIPTGSFFRVDLFSDCDPLDIQNCFWKCSPGTYYDSTGCIPCPPGHFNNFFDQIECFPCQVGTFYSKIGATSIDQCYPCNEGSYNNSTGQAYCIDCPSNTYCPAGSTEYSYFSLDFKDSSIQPNLIKSKTEETDEYSKIVQIALGVFGIGILVTFIIIMDRLKILCSFDLFDTLHNHILYIPMIRKQTKFGGIFGIIFIILALMIVIATVITFSIDNILETKTLVPLVVMEEKVSDFKTDMNITLTVMNYGGPCVDDLGRCANTIGYSVENIGGI